MRCLRNICEKRRVERVRNSLITQRCRWRLSVLERIERKVLKWFGLVKRIGEERLLKRVYRTNMKGNRARGISQRRWRDEVKELLIGKRHSTREGMVLARDREASGKMVSRSE